MTIEQELREYILDNHSKQGRPRIDLNADRSGDLIAEKDNGLDVPGRNAELILDHYGMGSLIWPTGQSLANSYKGLGTRERVRQIINAHYKDKAPEFALPLASAVAEILEARTFWFENDYLQELVSAGLTAGVVTAKQLLSYLHSQGLVLDFDVYQTDLNSATRRSYTDYDERVILTKTRKNRLKSLYIRSQKIVGLNGLCRIGHVSDEIDENDKVALCKIMKIHKGVWSTERDGVFWYVFEDRQNTLVYNAKKVFSVVKTCKVNSLARLLTNSLKARTSSLGEYPEEKLVKEWILNSKHFRVVSGIVSVKSSDLNLTEIEDDVVDLMRGRGAMSSQEISQGLTQRGHKAASIQKSTYYSSLVDVDRSSGLRNFRFTLVSELVSDIIPSLDDPYEILKAKLQEIEDLEAPEESKRRREQGLLRDWLFGESSHANCAICDREFNVRALVTAHKKKRSRCTESEKRDPYIVFPLCLFGCDYLYEHGFVTVSGGKIIASLSAKGKSEAEIVELLIGRNLSECWLRGPASYFDNVPLGK